MPFAFLLWRCVQEGKTAFREPESNKTVRIRSLGDESILVFHTDCDVFRTEFNLIAKPASDVLFFHKRQQTQPSLAFVEIKSCDISVAVAQLTNVIGAIKGRLRNYDASYVAVIVTHASAPSGKEQKRFQDQLANQGVALKFKTGVKGGGDVDIRQYLV